MSRTHPVAIVGPTGTGKSELSLAIAERLAAEGRRAEIVNADAMQLYRGMDIGTAKLTEAERRGIPHHLLDVLEVTEDAAVAWYQREARRVIADLLAADVTPVLVGGSGLYVSSVIFDFEFPGTDPTVRERLEQELRVTGREELFERLRTLDENVAGRIGPHNARRIVRALEVAELTGSPASGMLPEPPTYWTPVTILAVEAPREDLVQRLDERVVRMWSSGLVDEVRALLDAGLERSSTAGRAIGYSQAAAQIAGDCTEDEAIAQTQQLTRRYARRQMSWFRRYDDAHWLDARDGALVEHALHLVAGSGADAARP